MPPHSVFTSATGRAARLKQLAGMSDVERVARRRARWARWQRGERARRRRVGVCFHCGQNITEKFGKCLECRVKASERRKAVISRDGAGGQR